VLSDGRGREGEREVHLSHVAEVLCRGLDIEVESFARPIAAHDQHGLSDDIARLIRQELDRFRLFSWLFRSLACPFSCRFLFT